MKKEDYKDKGLRQALQRRNETAERMMLPEDFTDRLMERLEKPLPQPLPREGRTRLLRWIASAACLLIIIGVGMTLLPKEELAKQPLPQPLPREGSKKPTLNFSRREKPNPSRRVGRIKSLPPRGRLEGASYGSEEPIEPVKEKNTLRPVEESDIIPYEDPMVQFAEQARALRERGNRVIHRVSMNSNPTNNNALNDL